MDIWQWVNDAERELRNNGHERLADIIDSVPRLSNSKTRHEAQALVHEGVALARSLRLPWVEVFLRHWLAQCLILRCNDVSAGLDDVIRLLDFAHTDAARECPQSICVCQDVCSAYGIVDGPGYAAERLQVCIETLARIDATWPCFDCISTEYASALIDAGRLEEAAAFCHQQQAAMHAARSGVSHELSEQLCDAYSRQGQHEKALQALGATAGRASERSGKVRFRLYKSHQLALLGQRDEAQQLMVAADELEPSDYVDWAQATKAWCAVGCMENDRRLGLTLRSFARTLRKHGARHDVAVLGLIGAELALERGRQALAALHLDDVQDMATLLRRPEGVRAEVERQRASLIATPPDDRGPAAVLEQLGEDPEQNLQLLVPALAGFPDDSQLLEKLCITYALLGFDELSVSRLQQFITTHPDAIDSSTLLLRILVKNEDAETLAHIVETATDEARPRALYYQAQLFEQRAEWQQCVHALERARTLRTDIYAINSSLALAYRHTQQWKSALELLDELVKGEDAGDEHWERMVVGTALGRFDLVRDSARHLGFALEGEGPIDEFFAYCHIVTRDKLGREVWYYARRISPVVARISQIQGPGIEPAVFDEILFDPAAINPRDETQANTDSSAENSEHVHAFRAIQTLRRSGYRTYELDGVHPGATYLDALKTALREREILLSVRNSEEYEVIPPDGTELVAGLYAYVAVPEEVTTATLHALLTEQTSTWSAITYCGLLKELGLQSELERHQTLAAEMQL